MHFDIPFCDKNSERKMLASRVMQIIEHIGDRIFTDSEDAGEFLFREGQYTPAQINEGEWTPFGKDDMWGYREEYCWFKQTVTIPERFAGKPIIKVPIEKAIRNIKPLVDKAEEVFETMKEQRK